MIDALCPLCSVPLLVHGDECPPYFVVWCPRAHEADEHGYRARALSHRDAALRWAELYGAGAQHIPRVRVTGEDDGAVKWFEITGEVVTSYHAAETEEPETWTSMPPPPPKPTNS